MSGRSAQRTRVLERLAEIVLAVRRPHPVRVGIDGCSAAGKTTLADELGVTLRTRTRREILRVGLDHFKKDRALRTTYATDSGQEHYLDSWDLPAIRERLLEPLGPGGDRRYVTAVMDLWGRAKVDVPAQRAARDAVLMVDGSFLQRPELDDCWDLRIYVDVGFDTVLRRGSERDAAFMESLQAAQHRYRTKYVPGERMYVDAVRPRERAQVVVDNEDFDAPTLSER